MKSYHISPATGRPAICTASARECPVGGSHYTSAEGAREGFEAENAGATMPQASKKAHLAAVPDGQQHATVVSLADHRGAKADAAASLIARSALEQNYGAAIATVDARITFNKAEMKTLQDVAEGKKVKAEKLDLLLHEHRHIGQASPYTSSETSAQMQNILNHVTAVRSTDSTPSTLPTLGSFDPSKQTMFSNAKARSNPANAGKALKREAAHGEWMRTRAEENREAAAAYQDDNDSKMWAAYSADAIRCEDEARHSDAKVQAQIKEIQYLHDSDPTWASSLSGDSRRMLLSGTFRGGSVLDDVPVPTIKALRS